MTESHCDCFNSLAPFEAEWDQCMFWNYILKKSAHLNDEEATHDLHNAFGAWRRRINDRKGAAAQAKLDAEAAERRRRMHVKDVEKHTPSE